MMICCAVLCLEGYNLCCAMHAILALKGFMCFAGSFVTGRVDVCLLCRPVVGKFSHPYFKYLTTNLANPNNVTRITLNYEKFLVDAEGKVLRR